LQRKVDKLDRQTHFKSPLWNDLIVSQGVVYERAGLLG
jgi:hypothetical protein